MNKADDRIRVIVQEELKPVIKRLDTLNGWRNRFLGMALLAAVAAPTVTAVVLK